ncbi:hypothetical protein OG203_05340 [Nocardia sp. NBC_01499]|uniref:hypothetical protein n=1 Tax=Nocardia sp. NBC_01499 TaxID=2903597 RepID=UPI0038646CD1
MCGAARFRPCEPSTTGTIDHCAEIDVAAGGSGRSHCGRGVSGDVGRNRGRAAGKDGAGGVGADIGAKRIGHVLGGSLSNRSGNRTRDGASGSRRTHRAQVDAIAMAHRHLNALSSYIGTGTEASADDRLGAQLERRRRGHL